MFGRARTDQGHPGNPPNEGDLPVIPELSQFEVRFVDGDTEAVWAHSHHIKDGIVTFMKTSNWNWFYGYGAWRARPTREVVSLHSLASIRSIRVVP